MKKGSHHTKKSRIKISQNTDNKGKNNPFYGKSHPKETKDKMIKARVEWHEIHTHPQKGKLLSEEIIGKITNTKIEYYKTHDGPNKGKVLTDETKDKIRLARLNQENTFVNTSIERKVKSQLSKLNIRFIQQWILGNRYVCDFFIPDLNMIIEADGDYWHNLPNKIERDKLKDKCALDNNYLMRHISEHEINENDFNVLSFLE